MNLVKIHRAWLHTKHWCHRTKKAYESRKFLRSYGLLAREKRLPELRKYSEMDPRILAMTHEDSVKADAAFCYYQHWKDLFIHPPVNDRSVEAILNNPDPALNPVSWHNVGFLSSPEDRTNQCRRLYEDDAGNLFMAP